MYKLPTQFDAKPTHIQETAAGGGSTTTTCSCCVVTLLGANILAARQLASLASKARAEATAAETINDEHTAPANPETRTPMQSVTPAAWGAIGFFIIPFAILVGFGLGGTIGVSGALFGIATIVGAFCVAYDKLANNAGRGAAIALLFIIGICAASAAEAFLWLGAGLFS